MISPSSTMTLHLDNSGASLSNTLQKRDMPSGMSIRKPKNPYIEELKVHESRLNQQRIKHGSSTLNQTWTFRKSLNSRVSSSNRQQFMRDVSSRRTMSRSRVIDRKTWEDDQESATNPVTFDEAENDIDEEILRFDVQLQVQPRTTDTYTQSSGENFIEQDMVDAAMRQNEELTDENFTMRRTLEDMRFRVSELENERSHLLEEIETAQQARHSPTAALHKPSVISQEAQTDSVQHDIQPAERKSQSSLRRSEAIDPRTKMIEDLLSDTVDNDDTTSFDLKSSGIIQDVCRAHLERTKWLKEVKDKKFESDVVVIQDCFRAHLERVRYLAAQNKV